MRFCIENMYSTVMLHISASYSNLTAVLDFYPMPAISLQKGRDVIIELLNHI